MRDNWVYLVQTDTTVGFLSLSSDSLYTVKGRPSDKPFLKAISRFDLLHSVGRVPQRFRSSVRRSKKSSFILPNGLSFRKVSGSHQRFIERFEWMFTTSANKHGAKFDMEFAKSVCDVVVESDKKLFESQPSTIWRLAKKRKVRIR